MIKLIRIKGHSMSPDLISGDVVLLRTFGLQKIKLGDLLVVRHPTLGLIVKKLTAKFQDKIQLSSINPEGIESRKIGAVCNNNIVGKVIKVFQSGKQSAT